MRKLVIREKFHHTSINLQEDGEIIESYREEPTQNTLIGGIYKARVTKVKGELGLVWLDLQCNNDLKGFMNIDNISKSADRMLLSTYKSHRKEEFFEEGDVLMCQIVKDGVGDKKPTVTTNVMINGIFLIMTPFCKDIFISRKFSNEQKEKISKKIAELSDGKYGYIVRTSFLQGRDDEILKEIDTLEKDWLLVKQTYEKAKPCSYIYGAENLVGSILKNYMRDSRITEIVISNRELYEEIKTLGDKAFVDKMIYKENDDVFFQNYSFNNILPTLTDRKVELANGGNIIIDVTEALTVIDVNTANCDAGKAKKSEIIFQTNVLAAKAIAKHIRLRNIGGIIIIDFIDMLRDEDKKRLLEALEAYTRDDNMKVSIRGITQLGLVEMTRQRRFDTLSSRLVHKCPDCGGTGHILTPQVMLTIIHDKIVWEIIAKKPSKIHLYIGKNMQELLEKYTKVNIDLSDFLVKNNIIIHDFLEKDGFFYKILYE